MIAYFYTGQGLAIANECDFNREDIIKWSVPLSSSQPPSEESDSYLVTGMRLFPGHGFIFLPLPRAEKLFLILIYMSASLGPRSGQYQSYYKVVEWKWMAK